MRETQEKGGENGFEYRDILQRNTAINLISCTRAHALPPRTNCVS